MNPAVVFVGIGVALGLVGLWAGARRRRTRLADVLATMSPAGAALDVSQARQTRSRRIREKAGTHLAVGLTRRRSVPRALAIRLAICDCSLDGLCSQVVAGAAVGLSGSLLIAVGSLTGIVAIPFVVPLWAGVLLGCAGGALPVIALVRDAERRRRQARRVVASYLDLVILGLAGGLGIEGALLAAAELGETGLARRILATLILSRDAGEPPWTALARLGSTIGVEELEELAAAVGLAAKEGASIRGSLVARAATIRRHQLAEAEAESNAITERLFLPGVLLLLGFLLFIGYPAFARITTGF